MLNNCTFQGRFAADPEMRTTQSGLTVASFRMAVDRDNVGQDGQRTTDWLNFTAWRKTAEFVVKYFHKGSMRDLNIFYQELPDAVFGLRSLLFFYIFIRHSLFTDTEDCSNG